MPYIESDKVKDIRNRIKKRFPEFKISVTREDHSSVSVVMLEGPLDFGGEQVGINHYHYETHFSSRPDIVEMVRELLDIIRSEKPQKTLVVDSDYGSIPNFYINISAGKWDRPYLHYSTNLMKLMNKKRVRKLSKKP